MKWRYIQVLYRNVTLVFMNELNSYLCAWKPNFSIFLDKQFIQDLSKDILTVMYNQWSNMMQSNQIHLLNFVKNLKKNF